MATASFFLLRAQATVILLTARAPTAATGVLRLLVPAARTASTSITAATTRIGITATTPGECAQWQNSSEVKSVKTISSRFLARRFLFNPRHSASFPPPPSTMRVLFLIPVNEEVFVILSEAQRSRRIWQEQRYYHPDYQILHCVQNDKVGVLNDTEGMT